MCTRLHFLAITTWAVLGRILAKLDVGMKMGKEGTIGAELMVIWTFVGISTHRGQETNAIVAIVGTIVTNVAKKVATNSWVFTFN